MPHDAQQFFLEMMARQRDEFRPQIVEIGTILMIFRPFEIFRKLLFILWDCELQRQN